MSSPRLPSAHGFGFRWSVAGLLIALFYVASCDLFIPPDNNKPRYNSVHGEKHRPQLNPGGAGYRPSSTGSDSQKAIENAYGAPEPTAAAPAPGVSGGSLVQPPPAAAPQPQAAPRSERDSAPAPTAQQEETGGFWSSLAFWRDDAPARIAEVPASERRMPVENATMGRTEAASPAAAVASADLAPLPGVAQAEPMQLAANDGSYPKLYTTPARPGAAVTDDTKQRLGAVRGELEADRAATAAESEALGRDAVSEPSLLSTMPESQVPAPAAGQQGSSADLPPLPPPPVIAGSVPRAAPAPVAKADSAPVLPPVAAAPAQRTPVASNPRSAFERLTNQPLTAPAAGTSAPVAEAVAAKPEAVPAPLAPAPQPVLASAAQKAPAIVPAASKSVAPEDASIPLSGRLTPGEGIEVKGAPAIAAVAPPAEAQRPALEPIRLTPPAGMMADTRPAAPADVASSATGGSGIALTPPQKYAGSTGYLPASRYTTRRVY